MPLRIVVGLGWGDEGKGKVVDHLAAGSLAVARFSGGANAGHTVKVDGGTIVLHQVPSGMLRSGTAGFVGSGCVVDPVAMLEETRALASSGYPVGDRLRVACSAHLVHPAYKLVEEEEERARGSSAIGTTGRGIGPAYVRKFARRGIRLEDALDRHVIASMSDAILEGTAVPAGRGEALGAASEAFVDAACELSARAADIGRLVDAILEGGGDVIAEGAQGTLLDPDHGTYPYVTSGSCTASSAFQSLGIGPRPAEVAGVMKAYSTRVGGGPFPTELSCSTGEELRRKGNEYGATTGRPRRCGWLDAVLMRYSVAVNGCSWIALTLLDVLGGFPSIEVCTAYEGDLHRDLRVGRGLERCRPVYTPLPGWSADIRGERCWDALPREARRYVEFLESCCGAPVRMISTGPHRDDVIRRTP